MCGRGRWVVLTTVILGLSSAGEAQERGHVAGVFGWTFGDRTSTMFGGQFGVGVGNTIQIIGAVERMDDVITGRYALVLENIAAIPGVDVQGEVPATFGGVGARFTFPGLAASPFLEAQFGATRTDATGIQFFENGQEVDHGDLPEELQQLLVEATSFTFVLGAGLRFDLGDSFLAETTFEFFDVLAEREDFGLNRLTFSAGVRF